MICPHCRVSFHTQERTLNSLYSSTNDNTLGISFIGKDIDNNWWLEKTTCPACERLILALVCANSTLQVSPMHSFAVLPEGVEHSILIRPKASSRPPVPAEVPPEFARDYLEACLVLADSPKASAALSRRSLQQLLREKAHVQHPNDLAKAIKEAISSPGMPVEIGTSLDAVRNIGNFAAHPNKSLQTGAIMEVEPGEAEWSLNVIEMLFDHYFVRPADIARRTMALNDRLAEMGKPPITQRTPGDSQT